MTDLGPVPELDLAWMTQTERTKARSASIGLLAYAHQAESSVKRLGNLLDEAYALLADPPPHKEYDATWWKNHWDLLERIERERKS